MRTLFQLVPSLLLPLAAAPQAVEAVAPPELSVSPLAAIKVYAGSWTMTSSSPLGGQGKIDTIVNRCTEGTVFYTCEQIVNDKPVLLLIFVPAGIANHYFVQGIGPDGHAGGRSSLTIAGAHWTYESSGTDGSGKAVFRRTENHFTGADNIHFEQYDSTDGKAWKKKNEGDEVRVVK